MAHHVHHQIKKQPPIKKRMRDFNRFPQNAYRLINSAAQGILGISDSQLGGMFESAWELLAVGENPSAVRAFTLLCFVQPYVSDFWFGLGKALRENGLSEEALSALLMAETLDPSRFEYYQEAIGCCIDLNVKKEAVRIFRRLCAKKRTIEKFSEYSHSIRELQRQISNIS